MRVGFLLTQISLCLAYSKYWIFPTQIHSRFSNFSLSQTTCNPLPDSLKDREVDIRVNIPFAEVTHVGGYFCKKINHVIKCVTGFSGFEFSNVNYPSPISEDECRSSLSKPDLQNINQVAHVYPKCGVHSSNLQNNIQIDLEYQSIPFDKGTGALIHRFFKRGACKTESCPTVHPNIWWIGQRVGAESCSHLPASTARVYLTDRKYPQLNLIDTVYAPPIPFDGLCKNQYYCGKSSYVLLDGTLVIPSDSKSSEVMSELTTSFPRCPSGTKFKEVTSYDLGLNQDLHTLINFHEEKCESVLRLYKATQRISNSDLIYLSSIYTGLSSGYYINEEGQLEVYEVQLDRVHQMQVSCPNLKSCMVKYKVAGSDNQLVLPDHCFEPPTQLKSIGIVCMWLNGIGFGSNFTFYPHAYFEEEIQNEYLRSVSEGVIYEAENVTTDSDDAIEGDSETSSSDTTYISIWDRLWMLLVGLIILSVVLILVKIVWSCNQRSAITPEIIINPNSDPKSVKSQNPKKPSPRIKSEEVEMKDLSSRSDQMTTTQVSDKARRKAIANAFI